MNSECTLNGFTCNDGFKMNSDNSGCSKIWPENNDDGEVVSSTSSQISATDKGHSFLFLTNPLFYLVSGGESFLTSPLFYLISGAVFILGVVRVVGFISKRSWKRKETRLFHSVGRKEKSFVTKRTFENDESPLLSDA